MRQFIFSIFISFSSVLMAQVTTITSGAEKVSLADCFRLADENNLSLQTVMMNVDKAQLMEGTAWDVDKTELTLSQDPTSGGSPDNSLSLSQTIDFPTRYVALRHQLKAETNSRQSEVAVVNNQLHGRIASLYYQLVYLKEKLNILQRQDTILSHYENIALKRYNAGEVRQLEPLNASRLRHENQLAITTAQTEYANTQTELARLLGNNIMVEPSIQIDSSLFTIPSSLSYSFSKTPEGQLADAQLHVADEAVKVERTGFLPSLTIALRTQMVIKGWNPYHVNRGWNDGNFMGFEIGVGVPIFTCATKARVKAAKKQREQLSIQFRNEAQLRESQYTAAMNSMLAARHHLDYYTQSGNNEADETARISALAYECGEISYIEYVAALQQSIDTRLKYATAVNDYNQAAIKLMTLNGTIER